MAVVIWTLFGCDEQRVQRARDTTEEQEMKFPNRESLLNEQSGLLWGGCGACLKRFLQQKSFS